MTKFHVKNAKAKAQYEDMDPDKIDVEAFIQALHKGRELACCFV